MAKRCIDVEIPVKEYCEGYPVRFVYNSYDEENKTYHDVIIGINEGGCNSVQIDAKQLYAWLKEHYGADEENATDDGRQYTCAASMY